MNGFLQQEMATQECQAPKKSPVGVFIAPTGAASLGEAGDAIYLKEVKMKWKTPNILFGTVGILFLLWGLVSCNSLMPNISYPDGSGRL
jgi:hypothetical protein